MLIPLTGLISGIVMFLNGLPVWCALILAIAATFTYLFILKRSKNPIKAYKYNLFHNIWIYLAFCSIGIFTSWVNKPYSLIDTASFRGITGRLTDITHNSSGERGIVEVSGLLTDKNELIPVSNLKILLKSDAIINEIDDEVFIQSEISPITASDNFFHTGYVDFFRSKNINYQISAEGNNIITTGKTPTFSGVSSKIRDYLETLIEYTRLSKQTQNFLITILIGDRAYLDPETRNLFADAGVSHILALSGMHTAIIGGIFLFILFPLNFYGKYKLRYSLTVILLFFYAFITGWNPSTVRAALMIAALTLCFILERKNSAWNSLLTATFIILIFRPGALADIGLQLSFVCVAVLIFFVGPLNPIDQHEHPTLHKIAAVFLTTLCATLGTWCLTAYYFGIIPVVFLPTNLLVLPLLPAYLVIAIIYLICFSFGVETTILSTLLDYGYNAMIFIVQCFSSDGSSSLSYTPSLLTLVVWIILIALFALWANGKRTRTVRLLGILSFAVFLFTFSLPSDAENKDGFIIQKGLNQIIIHTRIDGNTGNQKIERYGISRLELCDRNLLIIDSKLPNDFNFSSKCDELIIGSGFQGNIIDVIQLVKPGKLITHPSLRRKKEAEIINVCDSMKIEVHSIRENGPYKYISD